MKKIALLLVVFLTTMVLIGCSGNDDGGDLKISVYKGGYGEKWINTIARKFEAEKGITVEIEANPGLQADIPTRLQSGIGDDIFFSHGIIWEKAAMEGLIEDISDIYEKEVENGVKLKDRIEPNFLSTAKLGSKYYKIPWTNGVGGLVYNGKMFEQNGWEVPKTYDELVALCETIYNANLIVPGTTKTYVKPFVWSQETYYWDYLVFDWWAQLAGTEFFDEYVKVESPALFNPAVYSGQQEAFRAWNNMVGLKPWYSMENSSGMKYMAAQTDFVNGYAAMIPCAQWLEYEMLDIIDEATKENFEMRMMPAPFLQNAKKDADGEYVKVNYAVGAGDSIIIPANAPHKELAKEFLLFLAKQENIKSFTKDTNGVMLAMKYDGIDFASENLSKFAKDVININKESKKISLYSNSIFILDKKFSIDWPTSGIQHYSTFYMHYNNMDYMKNPAGWLALPGNEKSVEEIFVSAYESISSSWSTWLSETGQ